MGPKRSRLEAGSTSRARPTVNRFKNDEARTIFEEETVNRPMNQEKGIQISQTDCPEMANEIERRGWQFLVSYQKEACDDLVREFYANAKTMHTESFGTMSWVRGKEVPYSREAISEVLGLPTRGPCKYTEWFAGVDQWDADQLLEVFCVPGSQWVRSRDGTRITHLPKKDFRAIPRVWATYIQKSIQPSSNVSDMIPTRALLVYAILTGHDIDIPRIIHDALSEAVLGGGTKSISFPFLIQLLCRQAGVRLPVARPIKTIAPIKKSDIQKAEVIEAAATQSHQEPPTPDFQQLQQEVHLTHQKIDRLFDLQRSSYQMQRYQFDHWVATQGPFSQPPPVPFTDEQIAALMQFEELNIQEEQNMDAEPNGNTD